MTRIERRDAVRLMASAAFTFTALDVERAWARVAAVRREADGNAFQPGFFTAHEYETVRRLVDLILPADERSGSATDAGVPEFMDFIMLDRPSQQTAMRGGLAWLDTECRERYGANFVDATDAQRAEILDQIAWPDRAPASSSHGVAFFNRFRDLTATGFWTTRMGMDDLQYMGNVAMPSWDGCPPEQLRRLGLT